MALLAVSTPLQAEPPSRTLSELQRVQNEMKEVQDVLGRINRDETRILKELEDIDRRVQTTRRDLTRLQGELRRRTREVAGLKKDRENLRKGLRRKEVELTLRLRAFYKFGRMSWIKMILNPSDLEVIPRQVKYMVSLAEYDSSRIRGYQKDLTVLRRKEARLEEAKQVVVVRLGELQQEQKKLDADRRKKVAIRSELSAQKELNQKLLSELEKAAQELQHMFDVFDAQPRRDTGCDLAQAKGRLTWPVHGSIVTGFGPRFDSSAGVTLHSNGIEIAAAAGTQVRAVCDGQVIFADWFRGYGQLVILSHGDHYYSVYGHASELLKQKGDLVVQGEPLAITGESGSASTTGVYFEVRHRNSAMDPLDWLTAP